MPRCPAGRNVVTSRPDTATRALEEAEIVPCAQRGIDAREDLVELFADARVGAPALVAPPACELDSLNTVEGLVIPDDDLGGELAPMLYAVFVTALKAHGVNGRIVVDEPVDLPDGAEVRVYLYDAAAHAMSSDERAALERALERSLEQADAGQLVDADEVLDELRRA